MLHLIIIIIIFAVILSFTKIHESTYQLTAIKVAISMAFKATNMSDDSMLDSKSFHKGESKFPD